MASYKKNTRMCIACRQHADKSELARFVRTPVGEIVFDKSQKLEGRGVWVHNNAECIQKLKKKRLLAAHFHENVPDEVLRGLDER